jgi:hypothetical protein
VKVMFKSRKGDYIAKVGIFLVLIALIVVMIGCDGGDKYNLTMAVAPSGSGTATDLTNASPYAAGTAVSIKAVAAAGYRFVSWAAPAGTFGSVTAAQTTFTMPAQNVTVTANFAPFAGGTGTSGDPYQIADWHQLDKIRDYLDSSFILINNLDSATAGYTELASPTANGGKGWQPIGGLSPDVEEPIDPFTGTFDGQGYEIKDLYIDRADEYGVGLFGSADGVVIEHVGVADVEVTGNTPAGGLLGWIRDGAVSDCYATGSISGSESVGGLIGAGTCTIGDSYSAATVTGSTLVGGLAGYSLGDVSNSHADGDVTGDSEVGGLVGENAILFSTSATLDGCQASGSVTGNPGSQEVGGLVGRNDGIVHGCDTNCTVFAGAGSNFTGGLVGSNRGQVSACDSFNDVTGADCVGGVAGENTGSVVYCQAAGAVTGDNAVGGLVGYNNGGTLSDSAALGDVTGRTGSYYVGGLVGGDMYGIVSHCAYLTGAVTGSANVGGLIGGAQGTQVTESSATGTVAGGYGWMNAGGLVGGSIEASFERCFATATASGYYNVGGLVGALSDSSVTSCYATGTASGYDYAGGLVGYIGGTGASSVSYSYSTGSVAATTNAGGLVAFNGGTVSSSFWDTETSGQVTSAGGTGKTTAEMQDIGTFTGASWDIVAVAGADNRDTGYVWNIVDDTTYPFLSWQPV